MKKPNEMNTSRMRTYRHEDGTVIFVDPGTEVKKKNRKRHCKDGAPKRLRGIPQERREKINGTQFNIGDRVRMKQEVLDELTAEGHWEWHKSLIDKILTVAMVDIGPGEWEDYWFKETPFVLAGKWLEAIPNEDI